MGLTWTTGIARPFIPRAKGLCHLPGHSRSPQRVNDSPFYRQHSLLSCSMAYVPEHGLSHELPPATAECTGHVTWVTHQVWNLNPWTQGCNFYNCQTQPSYSSSIHLNPLLSQSLGNLCECSCNQDTPVLGRANLTFWESCIGLSEHSTLIWATAMFHSLCKMNLGIKAHLCSIHCLVGILSWIFTYGLTDTNVELSSILVLV